MATRTYYFVKRPWDRDVLGFQADESLEKKFEKFNRKERFLFAIADI